MSGLLDKSLDEIIGSRKAARPQRVNRSSRTNNNGRQAGKKVSSKSVAVSRRAPVTRRAPVADNKKVAKILNRAVDSINSNKVSVEGLPRDINRDSIREFFQQAVGGVDNVLLSYNEKGVSLGLATITFRTNQKAGEAIKKFNGSPIDGGVRTLKLQLIVDPTKASLAARISQPLNQRFGAPASQKVERRKPTPRAVGQKKPVQKKPAQKKKPAKAQKKSLEDLDKEMADYFKS